MKRLILVLAALRLSSVPPPAPAAADDGVWANPGGMYKNGSSRKIDSRILFPREYDFPKTSSLTENQFSRKTFLYTIASRSLPRLPLLYVLLASVRLSPRALNSLLSGPSGGSKGFWAFAVSGGRGYLQLWCLSDIVTITL